MACYKTQAWFAMYDSVLFSAVTEPIAFSAYRDSNAFYEPDETVSLLAFVNVFVIWMIGINNKT